MSELKPCPFCGGEAKFKSFKSRGIFGTVAYYVECSVCKIRTELRLDMTEPVEAWNRRTDDV